MGRPGSVAARVTYLLEPKNWLIVTVVGVGAHADGLAGAGWGLLAAFFAAVLPTAFIAYGIRRGRWEDRNVGDRRPRLVVLAFIIASVATGLILLAVLGAPALLTGYLAFMLASVAALAAVTLVWKISIHCAVAAGSVTILAFAYGPLVLGGYLLVGLLGWSRVTVRDHTVPQVVGGSVLGAAAAFLAYAVIIRLAVLAAGPLVPPTATGRRAGSLREDLFAALDLLLRRAQRAGAVRAGIETTDLIVLLKGMFAGLAGSSDPALHERVFAVLADGLRPRG